MPPTTNSDQLHGTLDMLGLKVLESGTLHGYAIAARLERMSNDVLSVEEGSLYPALYRMEQRGWLARAGESSSAGWRRSGSRRGPNHGPWAASC